MDSMSSIAGIYGPVDDPFEDFPPPGPPRSSMRKIAIAGTGGFAQFLAHYLDTETAHQFILLSRKGNPELCARGWQVIPVDYTDQEALVFALTGVDTIISTVSGAAQIALIDAAAEARVRRFAPAQFEGLPDLRPELIESDRYRAVAQARLHYHARTMETTNFVCGIFYERFAPGGLASKAMGNSHRLAGEGTYLMDVRNRVAKVPQRDTGVFPSICLTSATDVARFVVKALEFETWAPEYQIYGERLSVTDVIREASTVLSSGTPFRIIPIQITALRAQLSAAQLSNDLEAQLCSQTLIATLEGRYDFSDASTNSYLDFAPQKFREWLAQVWGRR